MADVDMASNNDGHTFPTRGPAPHTAHTGTCWLLWWWVCCFVTGWWGWWWLVVAVVVACGVRVVALGVSSLVACASRVSGSGWWWVGRGWWAGVAGLGRRLAVGSVPLSRPVIASMLSVCCVLLRRSAGRSRCGIARPPLGFVRRYRTDLLPLAPSMAAWGSFRGAPPSSFEH